MSTRQVERELAAILQRRAEDAMNRTDTQSELLEFKAGVEGRAGRDRRRWAVGALAAAAAVVAGFALWPGDRTDDRSGPASETSGESAVQVAEAFLEAFAAGDAAEAQSLVAPGVEPWPGWRSDMREEGVWRPDYVLEPCQEGFSSEAGTRVRCPFDYYALGSKELGLEPFGGNTFTLLVADGKVVSGVPAHDTGSNGQAELAHAIGDWVLANHPEDSEFMEHSEGLTPSEMRRWVRLWNRYTQEYVEAQVG